ncbi:hypothetical protein PFICI_11488 [Pestalotiopsis fici W106-1]|uniref:DUF453 domain-containing protein n=1 Tax=Pestalotiopsis fici (strain W106-1 / CGMCC3.15140) TaxID=1229662 RepID=W3WTE2_PESFW|nr:uncharacterized protein PFICI_11488 [Pestalotiopsis fici W106-1]ETS76101.1 hypothetical protein PFICI_11488 [Pestalotiopsis fici W106-1]
MSAAVGPFAVDSGMLAITAASATSQDQTSATVRIRNTNTNKIIHAKFAVVDGEAQAHGDFAIDGVAGSSAPVELRFIDPAGSRTGKLFPTGNLVDVIDSVPVTCIDAGNGRCFVGAAALGVDGSISPQQIDDHPTLKDQLESIRRQAGVRMGLASREDEVPGSVPKISVVSAPTGTSLGLANVVVRAMSVGQPHKAVPVTVALALTAAAKTDGTMVSACSVLSERDNRETVIAHASGTLKVAAVFDTEGKLSFATVFRTARRLMEGRVFWKGV